MYCKKCGTELTDDSKFCHKCGAKTDVGVERRRKQNKTKDIELSLEIQELKRLIDYRVQSVLALGIDKEIIEKLQTTVDSQTTAKLLIKNYQVLLKTDLIDDLKSLSSNYNNIKTYLAQFIEFNIVENTFPHKIIGAPENNLGGKISSLKYNRNPNQKNAKQEIKGTKFNGYLRLIGAIIILGIIGLILSPPVNKSGDVTNEQKTEISKTNEDDDPNCLKFLIVEDTYGAVTKDDLDKFIRYALRNEFDLIERMVNRGDLVLLVKGTTVYLSDAGFAVHQIRVANTEIELYVVSESIKKKCDN